MTQSVCHVVLYFAGHSGQYCSYSTMEVSTMEMIHVVMVEIRETTIMQKEALINTVETLQSFNWPISALMHTFKSLPSWVSVNVKILLLFTLCIQIETYYFFVADSQRGRFKDTGIRHSVDMWHSSRNLEKRMSEVSKISVKCFFNACIPSYPIRSFIISFVLDKKAKGKGNSVLLQWLEDIVDHAKRQRFIKSSL